MKRSRHNQKNPPASTRSKPELPVRPESSERGRARLPRPGRTSPRRLTFGVRAVNTYIQKSVISAHIFSFEISNLNLQFFYDLAPHDLAFSSFNFGSGSAALGTPRPATRRTLPFELLLMNRIKNGWDLCDFL